jgi:hypothetical protein
MTWTAQRDSAAAAAGADELADRAEPRAHNARGHGSQALVLADLDAATGNLRAERR